MKDKTLNELLEDADKYITIKSISQPVTSLLLVVLVLSFVLDWRLVIFSLSAPLILGSLLTLFCSVKIHLTCKEIGKRPNPLKPADNG